MESDFDYFDAVEREVLVEKLMKERKKGLFLMFSALPLAPGSVLYSRITSVLPTTIKARKEAEQRWSGMRGVCATCSMYLCEVCEATYMQVKNPLK